MKGIGITLGEAVSVCAKKFFNNYHSGSSSDSSNYSDYNSCFDTPKVQRDSTPKISNNQSLIHEVFNIVVTRESSDEPCSQLFSNNLVKALSRSKYGLRDIQASIKHNKVSLELPNDWQLVINMENSHAGRPPRLSIRAKQLINISTAKHNKFCVLKFGYQHLSRDSSRKSNRNYLTGKAKCKIPECSFSVTNVIRNLRSKHLRLSMSGKIFHKKGSIASIRIEGARKAHLKSLFAKDRSILPSEQKRVDIEM